MLNVLALALDDTGRFVLTIDTAEISTQQNVWSLSFSPLVPCKIKQKLGQKSLNILANW